MMKKCLQAAAIVFSIVFLVAAASRFLRRDAGFVKNHDFYETDEKYDVIYLGSSHAVMGVLPMAVWNEYGIASFNLANGGQKLNGDYWILKNALEQKKPALVVLDVYTVTYDQKWDESTVAFLHESMDPMPLTKTKIEAVRDLVPEGTRIAFYWPFSLYHNRWENIDSDYFTHHVSHQKGAYENTDHVQPMVDSRESMLTLDRAETDRTETVGKEYLRKCIELCQEEEVPILLTAIPFCGTENEVRFINSVYEIAEEYGVPYLNGLELDVVNPVCDFLDYTHLNSSGARKWSSFLGAYMRDQYQLSDRRGDPAYAGWADDYANYRVYEKNQLNSTKNLYAYLMLLADSGFGSCVRVAADSAVYEDELFWELLKNAGGIEKPEEHSVEQTFLIDHFKEEASWSMEGSFGFPNDAGADIEVMVFDSGTGEYVSHVGFSSEEDNAMVYPVL